MFGRRLRRFGAALIAMGAMGASGIINSGVAFAAPPETAALIKVPATWSSPQPAAHCRTAPTGAVAFDAQAWISGNLWQTDCTGPDRPPADTITDRVAVIQQCTKSGCSMTRLPGPSRVEWDGRSVAPSVDGVTGRSSTDLWAWGSFHIADNTEEPLLWRSDGNGWRQVPTTGMAGGSSQASPGRDLTIRQLVPAPDGELWALVDRDYDGISGAVYRLVGDTWLDVSPSSAPAFPAPCLPVDIDTYNVWNELVFVSGEPVLVGRCLDQNVLLKRRGSTWSRIDRGLPTTTDPRGWTNAAVVDKQLWVQGVRDGAPIIWRRASGTWVAVPTTSLPSGATIGDLSGTVARNLWAVGQATVGQTRQPAAWRWTGSTWRSVPVPGTTSGPGALTSGYTAGYDRGWFVGTVSAADPAQQGLVLREK